MASYVIGDVQGCFQELIDLLDKINFDPAHDRLWFTGDLVNRGPQSLEVMRFVKKLGEQTVIVLGNHDLHLLAVAHDPANKHRKDTLDEIIAARDRDGLLGWLRTRPLFHRDEELGFTLVHAGLPPQWDIAETGEYAREVETILGHADHAEFFEHMYGDQPAAWSGDLKGWKRIRFITNAFTRLRYCDESGRFALDEKGPPGSQAQPYQPWFTLNVRRTRNEKIIFGHWSTVYLGNITDFKKYNVYPLDTGCMWGGTLAALRLDDETWFSVPSRQPQKFGD
ncbi:MAG: symmetrical bis(5'-nucleosyl)-tetraphosphatase [Gammaproteobacteria bacterium]